MHRTAFHRGQRHPLAPAALLLLALCLLAAGAQAADETANTSVPVAGDGQTIDGIVLHPDGDHRAADADAVRVRRRVPDAELHRRPDERPGAAHGPVHRYVVGVGLRLALGLR